VPGWALREDVERATRLRLPERLPVLHGRGLLDREDARAPNLSRPAWIYRISQAGADRVADDAGLPRLPVLRPPCRAGCDTDAAIHIPPGAALALRELRRATEMRVESPHLPREPGWRSIQDMAEQFRDEGRARPVWEPRGRRRAWEPGPETEEREALDLPGEPWMGDDDWTDQAVREEREEGWDPLYGDMPLARAERTPGPGDLEWLVRAGLAQKWTAHHPGRRAVPLYRITALGGVAIRLEWREPQ
jgi:hypothetical protein